MPRDLPATTFIKCDEALLLLDGRLSCRIADVAFSHIYALNWMSLAAAAIVNSAFVQRERAERRIFALYL